MSQYDAVIIGAGMSGLAAGIRLAMFDQKVCILEKHLISGAQTPELLVSALEQIIANPR